MTTTQKKIVDNILELLIQLTEDGENSVQQTPTASTANKVEMLTIKESAALISGLSEHTIRKLVKQGKGSLSHNNLEFTAQNIDLFRIADNIIFVQQDLGKTYHQLFGEAVQKREKMKKEATRISREDELCCELKKQRLLFLPAVCQRIH